MTADEKRLPDISNEYIVDRHWKISGEADLYFAQHIRGGKYVIKLMHSVEEEDRRAYFDWLKQQTKLNHPRILSITDVGLAKEPEGQPFAVTEYFIWENTLRDLIQKLGALHPGLAEQIVLAILDGLRYAHGLDPPVLHRDLKPENVLLVTTHTRLMDLKLIDFSMAASASYRIAGTPPYQSPEQTFRDGELLPASDIFSAGTIFYELLTGSPAFYDSSLSAMQDRIRAEELELDNEHIDAYQAEFLRRCLAKDPAHRFTTAAEAFEHLRTKPLVVPATKHFPRIAVGILAAMMGVVLLALLVLLAGRLGDREPRGDEARTTAIEAIQSTKPNTEPTESPPQPISRPKKPDPGPRPGRGDEIASAGPAIPFSLEADNRVLGKSWANPGGNASFRGFARLKTKRCRHTQSCYMAVIRDDGIRVWDNPVRSGDGISLPRTELRVGSSYTFVLMSRETFMDFRDGHGTATEDSLSQLTLRYVETR